MAHWSIQFDPVECNCCNCTCRMVLRARIGGAPDITKDDCPALWGAPEFVTPDCNSLTGGWDGVTRWYHPDQDVTVTADATITCNGKTLYFDSWIVHRFATGAFVMQSGDRTFTYNTGSTGTCSVYITAYYIGYDHVVTAPGNTFATLCCPCGTWKSCTEGPSLVITPTPYYPISDPVPGWWLKPRDGGPTEITFTVIDELDVTGSNQSCSEHPVYTCPRCRHQVTASYVGYSLASQCSADATIVVNVVELDNRTPLYRDLGLGHSSSWTMVDLPNPDCNATCGDGGTWDCTNFDTFACNNYLNPGDPPP